MLMSARSTNNSKIEMSGEVVVMYFSGAAEISRASSSLAATD
jgi:hypothetical protein